LKPNILVIGGAGYIGSHMVRLLLEQHYQPVIFDNLSTGHLSSVPNKAIFVRGDLQNSREMEAVLSRYRFEAVMHFAAASVVSESMLQPLHYYRNNVLAFIHLLEQMKIQKISNLIFSSTAAVYGQPQQNPITEECPCAPINPYGRSKVMMEQIAADCALAYPLSYVVFRYFNAAGAHSEGHVGESHYPETHLIPNVIAAALDNKELKLYGNNYPTRDGTCVRDYIHVDDLCRAHLLGLKHLENQGSSDIFNLGCEAGYSVKEIIQMVEKVTGNEVLFRAAPKRMGDPPELVADSGKARRILGWRPEKNLEMIVTSALRWWEKSEHGVEYV